MPETTDVYSFRGRTLIDQAGEKIGNIEQLYQDDEGGQPEWATVTSGLFGTKSHFVPLAGASLDGEQVRVAVSKQQVKDAPGLNPDGELSEEEEVRLFEHYGVPYTTEGTATAKGEPGAAGLDTAAGPGLSGREGEAAAAGGERVQRSEGYDVSGATTDEAITRSEEELRVGKAQRERGRVRLRKYVETEQVRTTVPVSREEVRIEREPITDANRDQSLAGPEISEEEHEVILHEEEPVVEKRVVPKERVRLGTETVSEEREVTEQVRKERIDTDPADDRLT